MPRIKPHRTLKMPWACLDEAGGRCDWQVNWRNQEVALLLDFHPFILRPTTWRLDSEASTGHTEGVWKRMYFMVTFLEDALMLRLLASKQMYVSVVPGDEMVTKDHCMFQSASSS